MRYVAFFRNVNLGQGNSPTRAQLESAVTDGGAEFARSFLSNGTVILAADSKQAAAQIVERARGILESLCGLTEPAYVSPLETLSGLVTAEPFAGHQGEDVYYLAASFMPEDAAVTLKPPLWSPRRDLQVIRVAGNAALSVVYNVAGRPGDGTSFLERVLHVQVTTRSWNTIVRLVKKYG